MNIFEVCCMWDLATIEQRQYLNQLNANDYDLVKLTVLYEWTVNGNDYKKALFTAIGDGENKNAK